MAWSAYRTQIVVMTVAVAATLLVFGISMPKSPPGRGHPSAAGAHGATGGTPTGLGMAAAPGLGGLLLGVSPSATPARAPRPPAPSLTATPSAVPAGPLDPGKFAPGACVAFAPARGNRHLTVFLDAGHGGRDPGGNGYTDSGHEVTEAVVNLRVEMAAMTLLTQQGYRVVVSRTGPGPVHPVGPGDLQGGGMVPHAVRADIAARDVCANMAKANLLIGIYMNAYWGGAGSVTIYCGARPFSAESHRFAQLLQHEVLAALNAHKYDIPNDGVLADDQMGSSSDYAASTYGHLMLLGPAKRGYFSTPSQMPGALIEPLFLTDPFEASLAATTRGQNLIATGITRAVNNYFAGPAAR
jgi:N-acetylmuramoyl-L-alanine amidase